MKKEKIQLIRTAILNLGKFPPGGKLFFRLNNFQTIYCVEYVVRIRFPSDEKLAEQKLSHLASFQLLSVIDGEDEIRDPLKEEIINHLKHLEEEFMCYFPAIDTADI